MLLCAVVCAVLGDDVYRGGLEGEGWPVPLVTFGLIADPHANVKHRQPWWCDLACWKKEVKLAASPKGRKHGGVMKKIQESVDVLSRVPGITFSVDLGDLCDMDMMVNMPLVLDIWDKLPHPHYNVMGNHDLRGENDRFGEPAKLRNKTQISWLLKTWKLTQGTFYYSFVYGPFKFLVLDSMTLPPTTGGGRLKDEQMSWLDKELSASNTAGQDVIIFAHIPIGLATNPLKHILLKYNHILAVFHGHKHSGDYYHHGDTGKHMITLQGMIETNINAFAYVNVFVDRLELVGFGRVPSRVYFRDKRQLERGLGRPMKEYKELVRGYKGVAAYDQAIVGKILGAGDDVPARDVFSLPFRHPGDVTQKQFIPLEKQSSIAYIMANFPTGSVPSRQAAVVEVTVPPRSGHRLPLVQDIASWRSRAPRPPPAPPLPHDLTYAPTFLTLLMISSGFAGAVYLTKSLRNRGKRG
eukprot:TRINITY_DN15522_c0_g1_i1.p1 TRINITY_DN15522_c0_g1~~TRINITY_DN15522_c0_g1_i1.p1  ORF type:complete len:467 (+),score=129.56 TRINITY_DN15522_c0_g1_i1:53-1453(+)